MPLIIPNDIQREEGEARSEFRVRSHREARLRHLKVVDHFLEAVHKEQDNVVNQILYPVPSVSNLLLAVEGLRDIIEDLLEKKFV